MHISTITTRRRGISTIMGTLIFVGILFTSVIPMYLVMKQADNIYTQNTVKMANADLARSMEKLDVTLSPIGMNGPLEVYATNIGVQGIRIVRIWINDVIVKDDAVSLSPNTQTILGTFDVDLPDPPNGITYKVRVTTDKGNVFTGNAPVSYHDDHWDVTNLVINVLISYPGPTFRLDLYKKIDGTYTLIKEGTAHRQGSDQGSVLYIFDVTFEEPPVPPDNGYRVTVTKGSQVIQDQTVTIDLPEMPYAWIYS